MAWDIVNPVLTVLGTPGAPPAGAPPYNVVTSGPAATDRATGFRASGDGNISLRLKTPRADGSTQLDLVLADGRLGEAVEFTEILAADVTVWPVLVEYFGHGAVASGAISVSGIVEVVGAGPLAADQSISVVSAIPTARVQHIPPIALPGAGAFTVITDATFYPSGAYVIPASLGTICFWVTYRRASVTGFPVTRPRFSNGTEAGRYPVVQDILDTSFTPSGRQVVFNSELAFPPPGVAGDFAYAPIWFRVPPGATTAWLEVAEAGDTAAPGTISVAITGDYRT